MNKKSPEVFLKSSAALMIWENEVTVRIAEVEWEAKRPGAPWGSG